MASYLRGSDNFDSADNATQTELDAKEVQMATAWVNFDGTPTTPTISDSFNVSSITRNGVGDFTVNFTTAMDNANYTASLSGRGVVGNECIVVEQHDTPLRSTTQLRIYTQDNVGTLKDYPVVSVVIHGGKA